ncbi:glycoprotease family-domain-containing protein [Kalaharituber pfeilii]|nr:glycoprotease family-domain-containing protein [Kalaharituber pfeilii]
MSSSLLLLLRGRSVRAGLRIVLGLADSGDSLSRLRWPSHSIPLSPHWNWNLGSRRGIIVLGIETSCDDTSVALLSHTPTLTHLLYHETITSNNLPTRGIHPLASLSSHRSSLSPLLICAISRLPPSSNGKPDLVAATRGPGMRASLAVGLDVAKGLAVAWGVPLVGVHHMLGHALTPRLTDALQRPKRARPKGTERNINLQEPQPRFPFWSLLVSGGHTVLARCESVTRHKVIADTVDVAVGDMIDKIARRVVPEEIITEAGKEGKGVVYGRVLEEFVFPGSTTNGEAEYDHHYFPPESPSGGSKMKK